jgi:hypothetical protein
MEVQGRMVLVSGVSCGEKYAIFNMQGGLVESGFANTNSIEVALSHSGSYLLYISGQFKKISVK